MNTHTTKKAKLISMQCLQHITLCGKIICERLSRPTFAWKNHTIIGAESFHGPVRDGKVWDQLAMAAKLKLYKSVKP